MVDAAMVLALADFVFNHWGGIQTDPELDELLLNIALTCIQQR
jgi:agmatine/peptidylarginine deiminase